MLHSWLVSLACFVGVTLLVTLGHVSHVSLFKFPKCSCSSACRAGRLMRAWPARNSRALLSDGEVCEAVIALNHELPPCTPRLLRAAAALRLSRCLGAGASAGHAQPRGGARHAPPPLPARGGNHVRLRRRRARAAAVPCASAQKAHAGAQAGAGALRRTQRRRKRRRARGCGVRRSRVAPGAAAARARRSGAGAADRGRAVCAERRRRRAVGGGVAQPQAAWREQQSHLELRFLVHHNLHARVRGCIALACIALARALRRAASPRRRF